MYETTRRAIRQRVETLIGDGEQGTLTSAASATAMTDTARVENTDFWRGADLYLYNTTSALNEGIARRVTAQTSAGAFTTGAFPATPTAGDSYELVFKFTLAQYNAAIDEAIRRSQGLHWVPWQYDGLVIAASTYDYDLPVEEEQTITVDAGGTTTTLIDAALTQAADYWNGSRVVGRSGTAGNLGQVREVTAFSATLDTLTLGTALPSTPAAGDTFRLSKYLPERIYFVEYLPSGATSPIAMADRDWQIVWRGRPVIRFLPGHVPPVSSTVRIYGLREPKVPVHDLDPIEVPDNFAVNFAYWQMLRSRPRKADYKLDADDELKKEAFATAMSDLNRGRYHPEYLAVSKKVR